MSHSAPDPTFIYKTCDTHEKLNQAIVKYSLQHAFKLINETDEKQTIALKRAVIGVYYGWKIPASIFKGVTDYIHSGCAFIREPGVSYCGIQE